MRFGKFLFLSTAVTFAAAGIGSINDFANYPGMVELIQANTKSYSSNFKNTFVDGPIYKGDGTAYGDARSGGNCLFPKKEYYKDMMYAALNNKQYNLDMGCGLCALVVSTSNPYKAIRVRIIDQCPECEHGSLDFSDIAFKALSNKTPDRIKISWALIPCDIDVNEYPALVEKNSPIKFQFKSGSTQFWSEIQVFNTRYPVVKVEAMVDGKYETLNRRAYNYWGRPTNGGFGPGPYQIKVTLADSTVIEAKNVEMAIPAVAGDDEGDHFSSGTQTILKTGSTSSGSSSSGGSNGSKTTIKKTTTVASSNTSTSAKCPSSMLKQGYSCCEENNCDIYYQDNDGDWGVNYKSQWCGRRFDCANSSAASDCPTKFTRMGYNCCKSCNIVLTDSTGNWGVENNQWCGLKNSC